MQDESDFILRQIRAFAEGLGYILAHGKGGHSQTEIIFPARQEQKLPHQTELQSLIDKKQYAGAAERLLSLQYAMTDDQFTALGIWLYASLNELSDAQLLEGGFSKKSIIAGLNQLKEFHKT
ncbi:DUF6483 family protein [Lentilactobacillus farraginis]|uniref:Uncharacterized protein n=1 Tax=Lentilactobacillus farraginis DSM 18382 = JCM 14108 TaxID=1423743 RepID=X0PGV6_9LACO|nr:DUF6483 family protein [Lentilactobacillus farraginis]KRM01749.1 hypothetical protein FD41_GL001458 [Lentilactobacillus farraginis DSM 18382 = JCM 14108]GAF36222.1 hypothetical protein JCM14108_1177 [Lentilactobacillus farraginis DSM 18382 = JCM 14108]